MTEAILHLTSGKGPNECRWVVARLAAAFAEEAAKLGLTCQVLDTQDELPASLLMRVTGEESHAFVRERIGTILWIGASPFRPQHKRHNWFVGVALAPMPEDVPELRDSDIEFQAMRASGPGGQHVNKTDSAVRANHRPTGLVVTAQEQRSQHANRKLAKLKLAILLEERRSGANDDLRHKQWSVHQQLERGNPVRTYTGPKFKLIVARKCGA